MKITIDKFQFILNSIELRIIQRMYRYVNLYRNFSVKLAKFLLFTKIYQMFIMSYGDSGAEMSSNSEGCAQGTAASKPLKNRLGDPRTNCVLPCI